MPNISRLLVAAEGALELLERNDIGGPHVEELRAAIAEARYDPGRDAARRKALDDLARAEAEEGHYTIPDDFNTGGRDAD